MTDLDPTSLLLGELKSAVETGNEDRKLLFKLIREVKDELSELRQELRTHIADEVTLTKRLEAAEEKIGGFESLKTKAILLLAGISSSVGAGVSQLLSHFGIITTTPS